MEISVRLELLSEFRYKFEQMELHMAMLRPLASQIFANLPMSTSSSPRISQRAVETNIPGNILSSEDLIKSYAMNRTVSQAISDLPTSAHSLASSLKRVEGGSQELVTSPSRFSTKSDVTESKTGLPGTRSVTVKKNLLGSHSKKAFTSSSDMIFSQVESEEKAGNSLFKAIFNKGEKIGSNTVTTTSPQAVSSTALPAVPLGQDFGGVKDKSYYTLARATVEQAAVLPLPKIQISKSTNSSSDSIVSVGKISMRESKHSPASAPTAETFHRRSSNARNGSIKSSKLSRNNTIRSPLAGVESNADESTIEPLVSIHVDDDDSKQPVWTFTILAFWGKKIPCFPALPAAGTRNQKRGGIYG
ncbi:hypothetical protein BDR26DRAFT_594527 [Obelidium mucronatum]|nr:hypothetical protein BDR26DRAFT_594527 [Obelidium mucronatum]